MKVLSWLTVSKVSSTVICHVALVLWCNSTLWQDLWKRKLWTSQPLNKRAIKKKGQGPTISFKFTHPVTRRPSTWPYLLKVLLHLNKFHGPLHDSYPNHDNSSSNILDSSISSIQHQFQGALSPFTSVIAGGFQKKYRHEKWYFSPQQYQWQDEWHLEFEGSVILLSRTQLYPSYVTLRMLPNLS